MGKKIPMDQMKTLKKIKSSPLERSLSLAKLTLKAGVSLSTHGVKKILKENPKESEKDWNQLVLEQAKAITSEFGELKGSLMKAGQMFSVLGEHFLSPEANKFLKQLQSNSPPLSWEKVEATLKAELGQEKLNLLEVDQNPYASASLGQVHLAKIKNTNSTIALKIQYEGVDKAIDSDIRALKTLLKLAKLLPKDLNTDPLFNEVKTMLEAETNYQLELEQTDRFKKLMDYEPQFAVPQTFKEFSTKKVLATSFMEGVSADHETVQGLSQDRRNRLGELFIQHYYDELFKWGAMQTDPHLGNYKIQINSENSPDRIVFLDFGATRNYDQDFLKKYRVLVAASLTGAPEKVQTAAYDLRFLEWDDPAELKDLFTEFCFMMVEPFLAYDDERAPKHLMDKDGVYDWGRSDLPQRLLSMLWKFKSAFKLRTPPQEVIFLDRKTAGVFTFVSVLKAKINGREMLLRYLKDSE